MGKAAFEAGRPARPPVTLKPGERPAFAGTRPYRILTCANLLTSGSSLNRTTMHALQRHANCMPACAHQHQQGGRQSMQWKTTTNLAITLRMLPQQTLTLETSAPSRSIQLQIRISKNRLPSEAAVPLNWTSVSFWHCVGSDIAFREYYALTSIPVCGSAFGAA